MSWTADPTCKTTWSEKEIEYIGNAMDLTSAVGESCPRARRQVIKAMSDATGVKVSPKVERQMRLTVPDPNLDDPE